MSGKYLWAVGNRAKTIPVDETVGQRYTVVSPQIWLDTQPEQLPDFPTDRSADFPAAAAYFQAYPHCLHVPAVYGTCPMEADPDILLLENAPIDSVGCLYPTLPDQWGDAAAVRQIYWLWQILQLWQPLLDLGLASSLLQPENLRVQGWRVRLLELYGDPSGSAPSGPLAQANPVLPSPAWSSSMPVGINDPESAAEGNVSGAAPPESPGSDPQRSQSPNLGDLAACWLQWVPTAQSEGFLQLQDICTEMGKPDAALPDIEAQLNRLLLEQSATLPLTLKVVGTTIAGPQLPQNEDACYPNDIGHILESEQLENRDLGQLADGSAARVTIVCDGVGGHEGGEVASQLAVRSLQLQVQSLITEALAQTDLTAPQVVAEQLEASIRIVNNLIADKNDDQGRSERQRMGTTLVMALQLPQVLPSAVADSVSNLEASEPTSSASSNRIGHELYIVHLGDSRAYWLTADACHLLTTDDTVAVREVKAGRSVYRQALTRPDGQALTQALGTRRGEFVQPHIQRFLVEEDGLLVLCSDGLSDYDLVEKSWANYAGVVLRGVVRLDDAVQSWVNLASQKNGHDNISLVAMQCQVSPPSVTAAALSQVSDGPDLTEASQALLYGETDEAAVSATDAAKDTVDPSTLEERQPKVWGFLLRLLLLVVVMSAVGFFIGWVLNRSEVDPPPSLPESSQPVDGV